MKIKLPSMKGWKLLAAIGAAALAGGVVFLALLKGVHEVETTQFCGYTCHVMKPQRVAHDFSPHAKVDCGTCHIGPGVVHLVQSKIEASRETISFLTHSYPRPITSPVKHLRPARFTCEQCHWPQKYYGDKKITKVHFANDAANTREWVNLVMKTGGPGTAGRTGGGIHWHIEQEIDYAAADAKRLHIPWVRVLKDGKTTIFREQGFEGADALAQKKDAVRRMDCMDCHNRATHVIRPPDDVLDEGLENGQFPEDLPHLKQQASLYLNMTFQNREEAGKALAKIPAFYRENLPKVYQARAAEIDALPEKLLTGVFDKTQFPEMLTDWRSNPNHLGHTKGGPGCFRCHDGRHVSDDGRTIPHNCNLCHSLPAFGTGAAPQEKPIPVKLKGTTHQGLSCNDCHTRIPTQRDTGLDSLRPPAEACYQCHDAADHPLTAPMSKLSCGECHRLHPAAPQGVSCLRCHEGVQKRGKHAAHLEQGLTCTQCHTKHAWKIDDKAFRANCTSCHDGEKPAFIEKFYGAEGKPKPLAESVLEKTK